MWLFNLMHDKNVRHINPFRDLVAIMKDDNTETQKKVAKANEKTTKKIIHYNSRDVNNEDDGIATTRILIKRTTVLGARTY